MSDKMTDVEKLIERLEDCADALDSEERGVNCCQKNMREAAAMLRSLYRMNHDLNLVIEHKQNEIDDLRAEKTKVEEQANNLKRYVGEYASEIDALRAKLERAEADATTLWNAADDLIKDVKRRYPGEELRCPYMIALEAALSEDKPHDHPR